MTDLTLLEDAALIQTAARNPEGFAVLYRRYLNPLYRYVYSKSGNVHDAEDITSQVFIEALDGLAQGRYRENGRFVAWLFTIARRRLVDYYRRQPGVGLTDLPSAEPGLIAAVEKGEDVRRLIHLLNQLDADRRELLRLRFSAELSFAEIGQVMGRSEAAVKMSVHRAIEYLRDHWEDQNG